MVRPSFCIKLLLAFCLLPSVGALAQPATQIFTGSPTTPVSASNPLPVTIGGSSGGTSQVDEAPYNVGVTPFTPMGGFFQITPTSGPLTNGQGGWAQMTSNRALHINLRNAAGVEIGTAAVPLFDDITQWGNVNVLAGAGATGTGSPRTTQAQDPTTIAGSAPGTAGTPSTNVVTIQGPTSGGTPVPVTQPPSTINGSGSVSHSAVTTAYAANQLFVLNTSSNAVPTQLTVTATNGGTGFITNAVMQDSGTGATAPPGYTVYLFSAAPTTTSLVDRSAYISPYAADITSGAYLGSLTCAAFTKTNDSTAQWVSQCTTSNGVIGPLPYKALSGQVYVDALVAVNAAYTPIASETLTVLLSTTRDQ